MKLKTIASCLLAGLLVAACSNDSTQDSTRPTIGQKGEMSPINCQVYHPGEVIPFRCVFTDNVGIGAYNLEIHNNFDHHTHSTEAEDCKMDPIKKPSNPFYYQKSFEVKEAEAKEVEAKEDIAIPEGVDTGDYHVMINVTDRSGWTAMRSVSIKIAPIK